MSLTCNPSWLHQLPKPSSVFSAEISAIRMALEHIQIYPRGRYLILSDSLSKLMTKNGHIGRYYEKKLKKSSAF
jgi:hypothetical protein